MNKISKIHKLLENKLLIAIIIIFAGFFIGPKFGYLFFLIMILIGLRKHEFLLVLLFSVGLFKNLDFLKNFPLDLTALVVVMTVYITLLTIFVKSKVKKIGIIEILVLMQGLLVLISASYISKANNLEWWTAGRFILFNIPFFFLPLFIIKYKKYKLQIKNIVLGFFYLSLMSLSIAFHNLYYGKLTSWALTTFGDSYISLAKYLSFGIIIVIFFLLQEKNSTKTKIFYSIVLIFLSIGIIMSPSRGIIISLILVTLLILFKSFKDKNIELPKKIFLVLLICLVIIVGYITSQNAERFNIATHRLSPEIIKSSLMGKRMTYYQDAVKNFKENPLLGTGISMSAYQQGGIGRYPHNLFLETMAEYGIFGIIIFWSFFIYILYITLKIIKQKSLKDISIIPCFLFLIIFLDAMVSGDIAGNRNIWLLGSIVLIIARYHKQKNIKLSNMIK